MLKDQFHADPIEFVRFAGVLLRSGGCMVSAGILATAVIFVGLALCLGGSSNLSDRMCTLPSLMAHRKLTLRSYPLTPYAALG